MVAIVAICIDCGGFTACEFEAIEPPHEDLRRWIERGDLISTESEFQLRITENWCRCKAWKPSP